MSVSHRVPPFVSPFCFSRCLTGASRFDEQGPSEQCATERSGDGGDDDEGGGLSCALLRAERAADAHPY